MKNYMKEMKIELLKHDLTFADIVRVDGRSYQYLHREVSSGNEKVINELLEQLKKI